MTPSRLPASDASSWLSLLIPPRPFAAPMEQQYLADDCRRKAPHRRASIVLAALNWTVYLGWDLLMARVDPGAFANAHLLAAVRFLGLIAILATLWLSRIPRFESDARFARNSLIGAALSMFLSAYVLMWFSPFPYNQLFYFYGILVIMIFVAGPIHLHAREVFFLMMICMAMALGYSLHLFGLNPAAGPSERIAPFATTAFSATIALVAVMVSVQQELASRLAYQRQHDLQAMNGALQQRNLEISQLADDIKASRQQSEQHWAALVELQEALRVAAEKRDRDKSILLASAVHDLRQPVQAMSNIIEPVAMALSRNDIDAVRSLLGLGRQAVGVMRTQLNAMLDLSRLDSGLVKAEIQPVDIADLLREIEQEWRTHHRDPLVDFRSEMDIPAGTVVLSDPTFFRRLVTNLLENAYKYLLPETERRGEVTLRALCVDGTLFIDVVDNGQGIERTHIDSGAIFQPFTQFHQRRSGSEKGVGLGLAIVRAMLSQMPSHRLRVESVVQEGTRFQLEIPIQPGLSAPSKSPPITQHQEKRLEGLYAVLVEDDELVNATTKALLQSFGMIVESAHDLADAQGIFDTMERCPDVLICDYRLPDGRNASDVVKLMDRRFEGVAVIVLTGENEDASTLQWERPAPILRKPVTTATLLQEIIKQTVA